LVKFQKIAINEYIAQKQVNPIFLQKSSGIH